MSETSQPPRMNLIERFLIWLSAADSDILSKDCPKWERLKYAAFGASLLVPFLFGMIAASYAVSTLTDSVGVIAGFAAIWGFIIITIDRVLLATYRAFTSFPKKMLQFVLRITVAVLMGLTVSHPLTLMLFKDAIASEIERARMEEMAEARGATDAQKKEVNDRIAKATENLQGLQQRYQEVIGGNFLNAPAAPQQTSQQQANRNSQFSDIDAQIKDFRNERDQVQQDLNRWQKVYDDEISGARTGKAGIGPNARAIERDELVWRRDEVKRLNGTINEMTKKRTDLSAKLLAESAAANARIEESRREFEEQKLDMFKQQQGDLLAGLKDQIESASAELKRLRTESEQITDNTIDRVDSLKDEKRSDLMVQTMVLHHMFEKEGGGFALAVYIVITCLFTLIDTIPLVVKFFAEPGIYDHIQAQKEGQRDRRSNSPDRLESAKAWLTTEAIGECEESFSLKEIRSRAIKELLSNHNLSEKEMEIARQLTEKKLDFISSIQNYSPQSSTTPHQKKLPYHPEFKEFDDQPVEESGDSGQSKDPVEEQVTEVAKTETGDKRTAVSNVIPFEQDEKEKGEEDPQIPEPREKVTEAEVKATPKIQIKGGSGEGFKITGSNSIHPGEKKLNGKPTELNGKPKELNGSEKSPRVAASVNPIAKPTPVKIKENPPTELVGVAPEKPIEKKPVAEKIQDQQVVTEVVKQKAPEKVSTQAQVVAQSPAPVKIPAANPPENKTEAVAKKSGNVTGSIQFPGASPAPKAAQKAIEGTIFDTVKPVKEQAVAEVKPKNDFVEEPEAPDYADDGVGAMLFPDLVAHQTGTVIPQNKMRGSITKGGLSFAPLTEASPEDAS
ncbi:MAG: DUF4407 domain-containing protein [Verrucomicrobiales bacterium]|nr:DUF4407 domain-containing protein [Verrucomicrobiales bacterium]